MSEVDTESNPDNEGPDAPEPGSGGSQKKPLYKRAWVWVVAALVLIGGGIGGALYFIHAAHYKSTDDAFIEGHITRLAPQVPGRVTEVRVHDNQMVEKGDVLLEIDQASYKIALAHAKAAHRTAEAKLGTAQAAIPVAEAQVAQVKADVQAAGARAHLAWTDLRRTRTLAQHDAVPQQNLDSARSNAQASHATLSAAEKQKTKAEAGVQQARANLKAAQAAVKQAEVAIGKARLDLQHTMVKAPITGRVTNKSVEPGDYVQPGQQLLALVDPHVWVKANYKETELSEMRPGQPVTIEVDAYPDRQWKGHVDSFQQGTGSRFSLLPPENATGNYVKVVQRIPVKIVFDDLPDPSRYLLAPGMSVVPEVDVTVDRHVPMDRTLPASGPRSARNGQ